MTGNLTPNRVKWCRENLRLGTHAVFTELEKIGDRIRENRQALERSRAP